MEESKKKVFILERDAVYLEILKHDLEELQGVDIEAFTNAESCLERIEERPDLLIVDCHSDSSTNDCALGHSALRNLLAQSKTSGVLFVTAKVTEEFREEYQQFQAVDYISRSPWGNAQLQEKVKKQLFGAS